MKNMKNKLCLLTILSLLSLNAWASGSYYTEGYFKGEIKVGKKTYACEGEQEFFSDDTQWQTGEDLDATYICLNPADKNQAKWIIHRIFQCDGNCKPEKLRLYEDCQFVSGKGWTCAKNQKISGDFQKNSDDDKVVKSLTDSEFDDIDKFREAIKNDRRVILKNEKQKKGKKRK